MKILQVMAGGAHGGAETAFVDMCIAMHQSDYLGGHEVAVVTRANPIRVPRLRDAGLRVHTLPFGGKVDLYTPFAMAHIIKQFKPDIVQTWMSRAAQKTPNWQNVKTAHRYYNFARLGGYYKMSHFKNMDYFVSITPDLKRHIVETGNISPDKVRHINNFAETETHVTPVMREDLDTPENATVILTLARLHQSKALDVAIRSLKDLPDVYLWLAGEGPLHQELKNLAQEENVAQRVRFLGWRSDRAALLQAADICAFISRIEPFGTVFAQSWANETAVIVSDADGPRQFCRDGEDCLMVPRDDVGAFVTAVKKLQQDKALGQKLVANGLQRYHAEFTKAQSVQAYLDYYQSVLNTP